MFDFEKFCLDAEERLFIIAEAGVNHNGDLNQALRLVDAAKAAGCDAIKFQTWITEKVYSRERSLKPDYQKLATDPSESEFETIKRLELSFSTFTMIKAYCDERNILFFSTPDEQESADFLVRLGVPLIKTASQDVTNLPFLRAIGGMRVPVIYSTGACTISELAAGVEAIRSSTSDIIILHCVSCYPAPAGEMNLSFIPVLRAMFETTVGLSDHSVGYELSCAAVGLGARVFEKHLTLSKEANGPDHQASLEPSEMAQYVRALRNARSALGDGQKRIMPCEESARLAFRRFIVAGRDLKAGHRLTADDICFKKVVSGLPPGQLDQILGTTVAIDIAADTPISLDMLTVITKS